MVKCTGSRPFVGCVEINEFILPPVMVTLEILYPFIPYPLPIEVAFTVPPLIFTLALPPGFCVLFPPPIAVIPADSVAVAIAVTFPPVIVTVPALPLDL